MSKLKKKKKKISLNEKLRWQLYSLNVKMFNQSSKSGLIVKAIFLFILVVFVVTSHKLS